MNDLENSIITERREQQLYRWVKQQLSIQRVELQAISGDASFRRYFRLKNYPQKLIAVDAPPTSENCVAFKHIAQLLLSHGLNVPVIHHMDTTNGFMLLSDLGDRLYLDQFTLEPPHLKQTVQPSRQQNRQQSSEQLYPLAIDAIIKMQQIPSHQMERIPIYTTQLLRQELQLFKRWFLREHLKISLSKNENLMIETVFDQLTNQLSSQPQVFCHSDYHSRNLMICGAKTPGIIDFQDALKGPISFDLVSLLKDCYISWPREKITQWLRYYFEQALSLNLINKQIYSSFKPFLVDFDFMGLHRHIRVLGIFSRLSQQDGKTAYLKDIPLTFHYVKESCQRYPQFNAFLNFLENRVEKNIC